MTRIIVLISWVLFYPTNGRTQPSEYLKADSFDSISWEQIYVPGKRFIVTGEAHHVSCVYPFQLSQLKFLVSRGFRNLVWEVPYSYGYIGQQYIDTGNDSLLSYIATSQEGLIFWKEVHKINWSLPKGQQLRIWGVDHELGENTGGLYRAKYFSRALLLLTRGKGKLPMLLDQEFLAVKENSTIKDLTDAKERLRIVQDRPEVVRFFGDDLPHFKALVNRLDHFKVSRNDEMLEAFTEIFRLFSLDTNAKFIGRFGWGHTNKSFRKSISWLLENEPSSPVKNSTFVIGVHYLNCVSAQTANGVTLKNDGIVSNRSEKKMLMRKDQEDPTPIKIYRPTNDRRSGWAKAADILFVFSGFGGVKVLPKVENY